MSTIAVIGVDGAGKTTITRKLLDSFPVPMKYLYMGRSIESSNFALPTSRLFHNMRRCWQAISRKRFENRRVQSTFPHHMEDRTDKHGKIWATMRLLNNLAEDYFRQLISWSYELRGYGVLYDRHYIFDVASSGANSSTQKDRLTKRLHRWFLSHLYPQPDLVIFLDAPAEVLFSRKQETTLEYLRIRRQALLEQGKKTSNFFRIDATQPLEKVYADVSECIMRFYEKREKRLEPVAEHIKNGQEVSEP